MRIAVVSDIHSNLTAFEAVLADLRQTSPDLILHGGDLAQGGARPAEVVDRIRDLGWLGVVGNADEMLFRPESLQDFAARSPHLKTMFDAIEEMAAADREALGEERLQWLSGLPRIEAHGPMALVHASPESLWRAPAQTASDARTGGGLRAARPADRRVWAYSSLLHSHAYGNDGGQHGQRESFLRWRSKGSLPIAGRVRAGHPAGGIRRGERTEGAVHVRSAIRRLGGADSRQRPPPNALNAQEVAPHRLGGLSQSGKHEIATLFEPRNAILGLSRVSWPFEPG